MKLVSEIIDKEAHKEFRRFLEATGRIAWEKKIAKLKSFPRFPAPSPNEYINHLASRNPLTRHVEVYLTLEREGKIFRRHATPDLMKTCGYLKVINALFHQCKTSIAAKLRSILFDDDTVRAFLFELDIAIHFFRCNYDVQFVDLLDVGTYDLLISDGRAELEIECKTKSVDAGRKITRSNFALLCDVFTVELAPLTESFAVLFKCEGRLSGNQQLFHAVAGEIKKCRKARRPSGEVDCLQFEIRDLSPGLEIRTNEDATAVLAPHWTPDAHYYVWSNRETLIIGCESSEPNRVLKAIYEDLKHGAGQLSKARPSMLACHLEDIEDDDWSKLQRESGLAAMSARLLESPVRRHVNCVVYSSDKTLPKHEAAVTTFSATNLNFENSQPTYPFQKSFFSGNAQKQSSIMA